MKRLHAWLTRITDGPYVRAAMEDREPPSRRHHRTDCDGNNCDRACPNQVLRFIRTLPALSTIIGLLAGLLVAVMILLAYVLVLGSPLR